jgi:Pre-mRNA splicing factor PRP21 like protein
MCFVIYPVAYAQIDWHDFVVVETVDYQPSETGNLPPLTTPDEVGTRLLQQQRFEEGIITVNIVFLGTSSCKVFKNS